MAAGRQQGTPPPAARGYTFVAVLLMVALTALGLAVAGPMWSQQMAREREQELLRVGALYAQAIAQYHDRSPGSAKQYPASLDALLLDTRFVGTVRHLRTLYPDPVNPGQPWGLILDDGKKIMGVYSQSERAPVAAGAVDLGTLQLAAATRYADWKFTIKPQPVGGAAGTSNGANNNGKTS